MLHSKSSEAIRYLYKRVKQGCNRWKWSRAVNALTSYSKRYSSPVAWRNRSRDTQEPIAFHNQGWRKASSGGIFWICAQTAAHRKSFTADGDGDRVYSSHKSIVLLRKTWNIIFFFYMLELYLYLVVISCVLLTIGRFRGRGWVTSS